ncbi:zinc finger protein [Chrysochromulina tobinii]|uniref:Zinc finger protein n=1 Tax=Chrysochromulina tobinii TaxID=1460289 RepID=A0A0M0K5Q2_9EUKA|nr:zinc finger protein [Chrysochromulina tobinii]|eukprot:KOO34134.1 zinc finger protein [Chrysochromulina sp. CCMP291]
MATADALEPKLRLFLERRVSAALTGVASGRIDNVAIHERVPALVDGLAADLDGRSSAAADALNPADLKKRSARVHKVAVQAALAIENDPALRVACANGEIGTRAWVRAGIDWSVAQANGFFREGGSARLTKREVLGYSYATSGGPPDGPTVEWLMCTAASEGGRAPTEPLRLLDVGSCGTLFDARYDALACTALDLCPQEGNGHVLQCDFLQLGIGPSDGAPAIEPHERFPAGRLTSLPAASFDVVVLSLVLSYLPIPRQRHAMILKARQLLPTPDACSTQLTAAAQAAAQAAMHDADPATSSGVSRGEISGVRWRRGLLLIVDTYSVDRRARSWRDQTRLREWAAAIESAGFVFLRHVTLQRSHALAFATAPMSDAELAALATREPMEMHMKREQRAQGWEAGMGHGASWAAGTDLV